MRYLKLHIATALLILIAGCAKNIEVAQPEFEVRTTATTFKVGEEVVFNFAGKPENVTFYSGEGGSNYANKGNFYLEKAKPILEFTSQTAGGLRENSFKVMATTDDVSALTAANIGSANWTDLTPFAALATSTEKVFSGPIDLSVLAKENKPITLALKYESKSSALAHPIWTITAFGVNAVYKDGSIVAVTAMPLKEGEWRMLDVKNSLLGWEDWKTNTARLRIDGGKANTPDQEDWAVRAPLNLDISRDVPELGTAIKSLNEKLASVRHIYTEPGTYKATFVAFNHSIDNEKAVIKEVTLTILP